MLYKLIEGVLTSQPTNITIYSNNIPTSYTNVTDEILRTIGYKDLISNIPLLQWYERLIITYVEDINTITEIYEILPIEDIRSALNIKMNAICDEDILKGFSYYGHPLWLTPETQTNIGNDYLSAKINPNKTFYPKYYNLNGFLYVFNTIEELEDFYFSVKTYIESTLGTCWQAKRFDIITNEDLFEYVKTL